MFDVKLLIFVMHPRALLPARTPHTLIPISDSRIKYLRCNISRITFTYLAETKAPSRSWDSQREQDLFFTTLPHLRSHLFRCFKKPSFRALTRTSFQKFSRMKHYNRFCEPRMCFRLLNFNPCQLKPCRLPMVLLWVTLGLTAHLGSASIVILA